MRNYVSSLSPSARQSALNALPVLEALSSAHLPMFVAIAGGRLGLREQRPLSGGDEFIRPLPAVRKECGGGGTPRTQQSHHSRPLGRSASTSSRTWNFSAAWRPGGTRCRGQVRWWASVPHRSPCPRV
eukprot:scaffold3787_cov258-Pinguiococcus_pyrenoidosus.AAC.2